MARGARGKGRARGGKGECKWGRANAPSYFFHLRIYIYIGY